ncbi:chromatin remodeling factor18 isoform X2 [Wolffia australiana]
MELDDDWELSAEEFDLLEKEAVRKISERKESSDAASTSCGISNVHASDSSPSASQPRSDHPREDLFRATKISRCNLQNSTSENVSQCDSATEKGGAFLPPAFQTLDKSKEKGNLPKLTLRFCLHPSGDIAAKFSYNQVLVDAFHMIPRASWHARERLWLIPASSLSAAEEVLRRVTSANVEIQRLDPLVYRAIVAASNAPDLQGMYERIPDFVESKLLPFQREGIRFLLRHGGRGLLADEMGLGKTLQAIAFATCIQESWPVLVLTPSSLRLHWATMIQHWLNIPPSDIVVVLPQTGGSNRAGFNVQYSSARSAIYLDGMFNIVSYDSVPKLQEMLLEAQFKMVVADESHFLKNAQAKRTSASLPVIQRAKYAILLSGTPALSRPIELFKQLQALHPDVYKNVHEYGNRYCQGSLFGLYQGASNHEELHNLMKATVMIRRLKKDVLTELPSKRRQQVFLDLNEKDLKQVRALFCELHAIKTSIREAASPEVIESLKMSQRNIISKIYNDSAEAKIPAVIDYLSTVIEADCKLLIFAYHHPMLDAIHKFLLKKKVGCIRIDGSTPTSTRQELVSQFQENDKIKAAVLSIKAAGFGLTLTAASMVIFSELSWTPGDIIQAEDRAYRIGQVHSVNVYYLLANETVDDIMWDVVQGKLEDLGQMLDGHEDRLDATRKEDGSPGKQSTLDGFLKRCHGA